MLEGEHFVVGVDFPEMAAVVVDLGEVAPGQNGPAGAWLWVPELKPSLKEQTVTLVAEEQVVVQGALDQMLVYFSCDISLPLTHPQTCCLPLLQKTIQFHCRMLNHQGAHPYDLKSGPVQQTALLWYFRHPHALKREYSTSVRYIRPV